MNSIVGGHLFYVSISFFGEVVIINGLRIKYRNILGESTRIGTSTASKEAIIASGTISTAVVAAKGGTKSQS